MRAISYALGTMRLRQIRGRVDALGTYAVSPEIHFTDGGQGLALDNEDGSIVGLSPTMGLQPRTTEERERG
jgi:hypothetical protein